MAPARLSYVGGNLVLAGSHIDAIACAAKERIPVCPHSIDTFRVTVVSEDEFRESSKKFDESLRAVDSDTIVDLGVGCQREIYFSAIFWKEGIELRRDLGLPFKQLHIPLTGTAQNGSTILDVNLTSVIGISDSNYVRDHEVSAVIDYCKFLAQDTSLASAKATEMVAVLRHISSVPRFRNADAALLDLLAVVLYRARDADGCLTVSKQLMSLLPHDPRGYFRCASCYFHMRNDAGLRSSSSSSSLLGRCDAAPPPAYCWKLAMMLYAEAVKQALKIESLQDRLIPQPPGFTEKLIRQACQGILHCAKYTEFGCLMTSAEAEVFPEEYLHLTLPWNPGVRNAVLQAFVARGEPDAPGQLLSLESRERLCVYDHEAKRFLRLPRFFRWITPFRVAAMSTPKNAEDIRLLTKLGIGTVVTLTKEEELKHGWFTTAAASQPGTINVFVPVANYKAPSIAQVDYFFSLVDDAQSGRTNSALMVHCGGGKGRAGTFVACYLARYGFTGMAETNPKYSADDAVKTIRHMRPGSIETVEQERFIAGFVKELWRRANTGGKLVLIPEPESQDGSDNFLVEGIFNSKCKMLVCCGIPGSGKSTISKCLARAGWTVASQDETGSRDACAAVVSSAIRQSKSVVVDRCNPTIRDRKEWIDLAMLSPNEVACIFFDYDEELCLQRAKLRLDHPTLTSDGRCTNAIRSMSKSLKRPSMTEGFGAIVTIRSIAAANKFVLYYAGSAKSVDSKPSSSSSSLRKASDPELRLSEFHKFPRTRHLLNFGSATRDDLIMTRAEAVSFLSSSTGGGREGEEVVITFEEKVDGANVGFSIDPETGHIRAQNRSHFVTSKSHSQFKKLDFWIDTHRDDLTNILSPPRGDHKDGKHSEKPGPHILFGEWLQATHSIRYTRLPDYFVAFDIYDVTEKKFWSRERFWAALKGTSINIVPRISLPAEDMHEGVFKELMGRQSAFYDGGIEGVYVRRDRGSFLADRGKVVRSDFISGNAHWTKQVVVLENIVTRF